MIYFAWLVLGARRALFSDAFILQRLVDEPGVLIREFSQSCQPYLWRVLTADSFREAQASKYFLGIFWAKPVQKMKLCLTPKMGSIHGWHKDALRSLTWMINSDPVIQFGPCKPPGPSRCYRV
jgi:hypothetical protein